MLEFTACERCPTERLSSRLVASPGTGGVVGPLMETWI